jgi:hypothetical protein
MEHICLPMEISASAVVVSTITLSMTVKDTIFSNCLHGWLHYTIIWMRPLSSRSLCCCFLLVPPLALLFLLLPTNTHEPHVLRPLHTINATSRAYFIRVPSSRIRRLGQNKCWTRAVTVAVGCWRSKFPTLSVEHHCRHILIHCPTPPYPMTYPNNFSSIAVYDKRIKCILR